MSFYNSLTESRYEIESRGYQTCEKCLTIPINDFYMMSFFLSTPIHYLFILNEDFVWWRCKVNIHNNTTVRPSTRRRSHMHEHPQSIHHSPSLLSFQFLDRETRELVALITSLRSCAESINNEKYKFTNNSIINFTKCRLHTTSLAAHRLRSTFCHLLVVWCQHAMVARVELDEDVQLLHRPMDRAGDDGGNRVELFQ